MANFFDDNDDLQFLFDHLDLAELARVQEDDFVHTSRPGDEYGPLDADDAVDNYRRVLTILGGICGDVIAPRAADVDELGNTLNPDGTVTLNELVQSNLDALAQADLMGCTLPRRFGGLNCPTTIYTMAVEMISRADASLMNLFGLQGIGETINAFASEQIKQEYLPRFSDGAVTGAMSLTEPDAGSDLQAVSLRAEQDEQGNWVLNGVKRFITNGCGHIVLTLARSEPDIRDGRGLSLFLVERGPTLRVRHLEEKLGIHGSPTCEIVYNDTPAKLIGERQRGLISYVSALMNGARLGVAAQGIGVSEAAYRVAREYATTRRQFNMAIERLPAVSEMIVDMKVHIEASRALIYETCRVCDLENNMLRVMEELPPEDKAEARRLKKESKGLKRLNAMLTPMSKYHGSEMAVKVSNDALQVLGGSGYMKDYPVERHVRDARITTIYEGTTQLQIVAAVRGVCGGAFEKWTEEAEQHKYADETLAKLRERLLAARSSLLDAVAYVKTRGSDYMDLYGRKLVDCGITVLVGHLLLRQAEANQRKVLVAKRFLDTNLANLDRDIPMITSGDQTVMEHFETLAGPVPVMA